MVFSSLSFLFYFLPICVLVYYLLPNIGLKNIWLLISSIVFYFWGEFEYSLVLGVSILLNYTSGMLISGNSKPKVFLLIGVTLNLLLLIYYKYLFRQKAVAKKNHKALISHYFSQMSAR